MARPLRHELKYFISRKQYEVLSRMMKALLSPDAHVDPETGEYHIRSLYFDTVFNDALFDKVNGVKDREKYRIRIYNLSDKIIHLECKTKVGQYISKRAVRIPRELAEQLIAADATGLEHTRFGLLSDVFREMKTHLLRPVVIVDYAREPYIHPAEEVRITFDKQLRTGLRSIELFNPNLPTIPVLDREQIILEIKYNRVLPPYIADMISFACPEAVQSAASKYTLCRRYEGFE